MATRALINHDEIRKWADSRGAVPSCVIGTGNKGDVGMIRLDFPGFSGEGKLQPISWDEWFAQFDENGLALLVQDHLASGGDSNFNRLVRRESAGEDDAVAVGEDEEEEEDEDEEDEDEDEEEEDDDEAADEDEDADDDEDDLDEDDDEDEDESSDDTEGGTARGTRKRS